MEEESHQKLRIKLNINCGSEKFDNAVTALDKFVMVHRFGSLKFKRSDSLFMSHHFSSVIGPNGTCCLLFIINI